MSENSFTEVTSQSWFSRLGNALKGIVVGLILIVIAFPLLFWNEGRAVKRYKTLKEGGGAVISVSADSVDPANQGKLVHLSGRAETEETLVDSTFGVRVNAIKLRRTVEMYQWKEDSSSEQKKKLGGGTETVTNYSYHQDWSDDLINSGRFRKPEGHQNPDKMPYQSEELVAGKVTIGAFTLSPSLIRKMTTFTPLSLGSDYSLPENVGGDVHISSSTVYIGTDPSEPRVGDVRVSFSTVTPVDISLVANQVNATFEPYHAKTGGTIELLQTGVQSADAMFQQAQKSNTILTWILRAVGFIVMLIGFQFILAPLSVFADVVPIFGSIVGVGTGIIASMVAAVFSFLTIAVAWFVYRPILSIVLIIIAGGIGAFAFIKLRKAPAGPLIAEQKVPPPPPAGA